MTLSQLIVPLHFPIVVYVIGDRDSSLLGDYVYCSQEYYDLLSDVQDFRIQTLFLYPESAIVFLTKIGDCDA